MKQRGIFSLTTLILLAVQQKPLTKTRLMQTLILSYKRVGYYCDLLERKGMIEYDPTNHTYVITPRGSETLRLCQELAGQLEPIAQMIRKYNQYMHRGDYQQYLTSVNVDKPAIRHAQ